MIFLKMSVQEKYDILGWVNRIMSNPRPQNFNSGKLMKRGHIFICLSGCGKTFTSETEQVIHSQRCQAKKEISDTKRILKKDVTAAKLRQEAKTAVVASTISTLKTGEKQTRWKSGCPFYQYHLPESKATRNGQGVSSTPSSSCTSQQDDSEFVKMLKELPISSVQERIISWMNQSDFNVGYFEEES